MNYSIHTGNPVTDVVLNGKARRAKDRGIQFDSEFRFPKDFGIDAFDLSIILNNSLDNALEACEILLEKDSEARTYIKIRSFCKNNMFLMNVENSCDGVLLEAESSVGPRTRKKIRFNMDSGFRIFCDARKSIMELRNMYAAGRHFSLMLCFRRPRERA